MWGIKVASVNHVPGLAIYELSILIDLFNNEHKIEEFVVFRDTVAWWAFVVSDINEINCHGMKQYWWTINQAVLKMTAVVRIYSPYEV